MGTIIERDLGGTCRPGTPVPVNVCRPHKNGSGHRRRTREKTAHVSRAYAHSTHFSAATDSRRRRRRSLFFLSFCSCSHVVPGTTRKIPIIQSNRIGCMYSRMRCVLYVFFGRMARGALCCCFGTICRICCRQHITYKIRLAPKRSTLQTVRSGRRQRLACCCQRGKGRLLLSGGYTCFLAKRKCVLVLVVVVIVVAAKRKVF